MRRSRTPPHFRAIRSSEICWQLVAGKAVDGNTSNLKQGRGQTHLENRTTHGIHRGGTPSPSTSAALTLEKSLARHF